MERLFKAHVKYTKHFNVHRKEGNSNQRKSTDIIFTLK